LVAFALPLQPVQHIGIHASRNLALAPTIEVSTPRGLARPCTTTNEAAPRFAIFEAWAPRCRRYPISPHSQNGTPTLRIPNSQTSILKKASNLCGSNLLSVSRPPPTRQPSGPTIFENNKQRVTL
jgi:hypothetical protein